MAVNKMYSKHFVALSILFVLGNACITAPTKNANEFSFLAFLLAGFIAVAVYLGVYFLPLNKNTILPVWLVCFYCTADAFITFIKFISSNLLPESPRILIILPFVFILIQLNFQRSDTLFKFSLCFGWFTIAVVLLFFIATAKDFNIKNIYIYTFPKATTLFEQAVPYIKSVVLPSVLLAIFSKEENMTKSTAIGGLVLGLLSFGLCLLNSILLFGMRFSGVLDYPYSSAGSVVTFGYLFTRLDGFLYFVYLATSVVKCAVGIFVIKKSREKVFP